MKKIIITLGLILIVIFMLFYFRTASQIEKNVDKKSESTITQQKISGGITSNSFTAGSTIPKEYTCDGRNSSPELSWHFDTANSSSTDNPIKSYVLLVDDPDAQPVVGHTVIHWALLLPPSINHLPEHISGKNQAPITAFNPSIKPLNSTYKTAYYQGPCPPTTSEVHTYNFTIFALSSSIEQTYQLLQNKTYTVLEFNDAMSAHILASALLQGTYSRK